MITESEAIVIDEVLNNYNKAIKKIADKHKDRISLNDMYKHFNDILQLGITNYQNRCDRGRLFTPFWNYIFRWHSS